MPTQISDHETTWKPRARCQGLIVKELDEELLIYDENNCLAYCLNGSTAAVWHLCNGSLTVTDIARHLQRTGFPPNCLGLTWRALGKLKKSGLLDDDPNHSEIIVPKVSRRDCLHSLGAGAMSMLPTLSMINVPDAFAQASACGQQNDPCGPGFPPCCPGKMCQRVGNGFKCVG